MILLLSRVGGVGPFYLFCIFGVGGVLPVMFVVCSFGGILGHISVQCVDVGVVMLLVFVQIRRQDMNFPAERICVF